jgi:hypothetical protein
MELVAAVVVLAARLRAALRARSPVDETALELNVVVLEPLVLALLPRSFPMSTVAFDAAAVVVVAEVSAAVAAATATLPEVAVTPRRLAKRMSVRAFGGDGAMFVGAPPRVPKVRPLPRPSMNAPVLAAPRAPRCAAVPAARI